MTLDPMYFMQAGVMSFVTHFIIPLRSFTYLVTYAIIGLAIIILNTKWMHFKQLGKVNVNYFTNLKKIFYRFRN